MKPHFTHTLCFLLVALLLTGCDATMPTAALDEAAPIAFTEAPHAAASKTGTAGEVDTRKAVVSIWGAGLGGGVWGSFAFRGTTESGQAIAGTGVVKHHELDHIGHYNFTVEIEGTVAGRALRGAGAFSVPSSSAASQEGDGVVDGADFLVWKRVVLSIDVDESMDGNDW